MKLLNIKSDGRVQLVTPSGAVLFAISDPIPQAAHDVLSPVLAGMAADGVAVRHYEESFGRSFSHTTSAINGSVTVGDFDDALFDSFSALAGGIATSLE